MLVANNRLLLAKAIHFFQLICLLFWIKKGSSWTKKTYKDTKQQNPNSHPTCAQIYQFPHTFSLEYHQQRRNEWAVLLFGMMWSPLTITFQQTPGGTPICNRRGCSSEILNLTPKGDRSARALSKLWPLKESAKREKNKENLTSLSLRVIPCVSSQNPKQDLGSLKYWRFAQNTLSETKIQSLYP